MGFYPWNQQFLLWNLNYYYGDNAPCISQDELKPFYEDNDYKYYTGVCEKYIVSYENGYEEISRKNWNFSKTSSKNRIQ